MGTPGVYFDGQSAARWPVTVTVETTTLRIVKEDGVVVEWPNGSFRVTQGFHRGEPVRVERGVEALEVADRRFLEALGGSRLNWTAVVAVSTAAVVALAVVLWFWALPALARAVAVSVPLGWEERLGRAVAESMAPASRRCAGADAALDEIAARLMRAAPDSPYRIRVSVIADPTINAFAAPGGYIVVHSGLLQRTRRAEEAAGVLAHEIQHVLHRHPTRALFRELSIQALLAVASGDAQGLATALGAAGMLGSLHYRREDEEQADREGLRMMQSARMDPRGAVDAFRMLEKEAFDMPRLVRYLSTHPQTRDRIAQMERLISESPAPYDPLLPGRPWHEIAKACQ